MSDDQGRARTTGIEWTQHTWNPQVGCSIVSPGCTNCYAMRQARRLETAFGMPAYQGTTKLVNGNPVWTGKIGKASRAQLRKPLTHRDPTTFFVNSMSDLFHEDAPEAWITETFDMIRLAKHHTYQILTKRPEVAARYYAAHPEVHGLPQVWLGVSVEDRKRAERIDVLRAIPAATRFLSVEPLLGPLGAVDLAGIDLVITGGESGPGARFMHPDWVREMRDQCIAQRVAFFHKQHGTYASHPFVVEQGMTNRQAEELDSHGKGGALVDGRLWRDLPVRK